MKKSIRIALVQGYDAHGLGESVDDNPYPFGTAKRAAWERGWYNRELIFKKFTRRLDGPSKRGTHVRPSPDAREPG